MPWVQIALLVASFVLSAATGARTASGRSAKAAEAGDFDWPTADEGTPQAVIFGDVWIDDWFVLAVGNYRARPIQTDLGSKK